MGSVLDNWQPAAGECWDTTPPGSCNLLEECHGNANSTVQHRSIPCLQDGLIRAVAKGDILKGEIVATGFLWQVDRACRR